MSAIALTLGSLRSQGRLIHAKSEKSARVAPARHDFFAVNCPRFLQCNNLMIVADPIHPSLLPRTKLESAVRFMGMTFRGQF
jgi:hypothetical protein